MRRLIPLLLLVACRPDGGVKVYNTPPSVSITSPPSTSSVDEGTLVELRATVTDAQDAEDTLTLFWTSDVDGTLLADDHPDASGNASFRTAALSPGNHAITLEAVDSQGESGSDAIALTVLDLEDAPEIAFVRPIPGEYGEEGVAFEFKVQASDEQDDPEDLAVVLHSDLQGDFCTIVLDASGVGTCSAALDAGGHYLSAIVTDLDGNQGVAEVYFEVVAGLDTDDDGDGWTDHQGDCDDTDEDVHPNAPELDNDIDDDCDDLVDEGTASYDDDGDGQTELEGDCDDDEADTYAGATEVCDGRDNDCDTLIDDGTTCYDDDGDGYTESSGDCDDGSAFVYPGAPEMADGRDNDCDGLVDEGTAAYDDDGDCYCEDSATCVGTANAACTTLGFDDCDDANDAVSPGATEVCNLDDDDCDGTADEADAADAATWYADADSDGYGDVDSTTVACLQPYGYVANDDDCDDALPEIRPYATELCDEVDNDCDGTVDESDAADAELWYADTDGDTFGDPDAPLYACDQPAGYVADDQDCDDSTADINPDADESCNGDDDDCDGATDEADAVDVGTWYHDGDSDGYGTSSIYTISCSAPSGYVAVAGDCDDTTASASPAVTETCDSIDNDCDGSTDEGLTSTYYRDADSDGVGTASTTTTGCSAPPGYVSTSGDCDDTRSTVYPGRAETCDSVDNNCDGSTDEGVTTTYYRDADGDAWGTSSVSTAACSAPSGYVSTSGDCDDLSGSTYPGAAETCDSADNDCDGSTDEGVTTTYYRDADGDGYGNPSSSGSGCSVPSGYVTDASDCDDSDASLNPTTVWYRDADGDTYGDAGSTTTSCTRPSGYVSNADDCDDSAWAIKPSATESCDGVDNDCDGSTDEVNASGCTNYYFDYDNDGYGTSTMQCQCSASSYYRATVSGDCYDYNASAKPGVTSWFTSNRGDGSYDYNCDSNEEQRYSGGGICNVDLWAFTCNRTAGFIYTASTPSCGSSGSYVTGCTYYGVYCAEVTSTYTQSCR